MRNRENLRINTGDTEGGGDNNAWDMAINNDHIERARVERLKERLSTPDRNRVIKEYEEKINEAESTKMQKIGRRVLDMIGIHARSSEVQREREAMAVALNEYYQERDERLRVFREEQEAQQKKLEEFYRAEEERKVREKEQEELRRAREEEREKANKELDRAVKEAEGKEVQKAIEDDLNSRLLSTDSLENAVKAGDVRVNKELVPFEGAEIPVYTLKGIPFWMLVHGLDYRSGGGAQQQGIDTSRRVMEDPSIWAQSRDEAERDTGFGVTSGTNMRGDVISTTLFNSENTLSYGLNWGLYYGFSHVEDDTVLEVSNSDGRTSNMGGDGKTKIDSKDMAVYEKIKSGKNTSDGYNELLLRRYSKNEGLAKRPDYIVVDASKITDMDTVLRHAKYFNIPIIKVDKSSYEMAMKSRSEELLDSVSDKDSYFEIKQKMDELLDMSINRKYKEKIFGDNGPSAFRAIGRGQDRQMREAVLNSFYGEEETIAEKFNKLAELEVQKRVDFLKTILQYAVESTKQATMRGQTIESSELISFMKRLSVEMTDVEEDKRYTQSSTRRANVRVPGNCNSIKISFRMGGEDSVQEKDYTLTVYDGERIYKQEEALRNRFIKQENIDGADSSYYNKLLPIVKEYLAVAQENFSLGERGL